MHAPSLETIAAQSLLGVRGADADDGWNRRHNDWFGSGWQHRRRRKRRRIFNRLIEIDRVVYLLGTLAFEVKRRLELLVSREIIPRGGIVKSLQRDADLVVRER